MKLIIKASRNPKPEELDDAVKGFDEEKDEPAKDEGEDEDAEMAAKRSAFEDYASALKAGKTDEAMQYLEEFIKTCSY
jgi:hypothetical protein